MAIVVALWLFMLDPQAARAVPGVVSAPSLTAQGCHNLLRPATEADIREIQTGSRAILQGVAQEIFGLEPQTRLILATILSSGHALLEGPFGVGKTSLLTRLTKLLGLDFKRIQFSPDISSSDVTGRIEEGAFVPGPVFTNVLFADEFNRAPDRGKTNLMEAMSEGLVTDRKGVIHKLMDPFIVLAAQNKVDAGTYDLPRAQLDRFAIRVLFPQPTEETLDQVMARNIEAARQAALGEGSASVATNAIWDPARLVFYRRAIGLVRIPPDVQAYLKKLITAAHPENENAASATELLDDSTVTRPLLAGLGLIRALAAMDGRSAATLEDVDQIFVPLMAHRIRLSVGGLGSPEGQLSPEEVAGKILEEVRSSWPARSPS